MTEYLHGSVGWGIVGLIAFVAFVYIVARIVKPKKVAKAKRAGTDMLNKVAAEMEEINDRVRGDK